MNRKTVYEWAMGYCGDHLSHIIRGERILELLIREGLVPSHKVLDLGCGALSQGVPLIRHLEPGNYTGLDPNGWLIETALENDPWLLQRQPNFQFSEDFAAEGGPFDFVISHSVLSHVAQWQMEQALFNVRQSVDLGARWYASMRLDQYDHLPRHWVYPGVSKFRIQTVQALAWHAGWLVEQLPEWKKSLTEVAPNDFHDWVRFTAIPTPESMNELRISDEADRLRDERIMELARESYEVQEQQRIEELEAKMA